jgi:hypothetical protein
VDFDVTFACVLVKICKLIKIEPIFGAIFDIWHALSHQTMYFDLNIMFSLLTPTQYDHFGTKCGVKIYCFIGPYAAFPI